MRALIITADLFEDSELEIPYQTLRKLGLNVDIVSIKKKKYWRSPNTFLSSINP
jgi:putative intracellular protease/amidase